MHRVELGLVLALCCSLQCSLAGAQYEASSGMNSTQAIFMDDEQEFTWTASSVNNPSSFQGTAGIQQNTEYDDGFLPDKAHPDFMWDNCAQSDDGRVVLNGTETCSLQVQGMDVHADLLTGGIDGIYELVSCYYGKGLYIRLGSPLGEERCIWYNPSYGDWQVALSEHPSDGETVMYGNYGQVSPLEVEDWHLGADFNAVESELVPPEQTQPLFYKIKGVSVRCVTDEDLAAVKVLIAKGGQQEYPTTTAKQQ